MKKQIASYCIRMWLAAQAGLSLPASIIMLFTSAPWTAHLIVPGVSAALMWIVFCVLVAFYWGDTCGNDF